MSGFLSHFAAFMLGGAFGIMCMCIIVSGDDGDE